MYKVLPMPTVFEAGTSAPAEELHSADIPTCYCDIDNKCVIFGDVAYGKKRTIIYAKQLIDFLLTARIVHNSSVPLKLNMFMEIAEFSIRTHDQYMFIADVKCDPQYATTRWLETVARLFEITIKELE